jgi:galactonate dehydratase
MSATPTVAQISTRLIEVSARTTWVFVELSTTAGERGVGEATLEGSESEVVDAVAALDRLVVGRSIADIDEFVASLDIDAHDLAHRVAVAAVEQALWDVVGQDCGLPVRELHGAGHMPPAIPVYANINRSLLASRTSDDFARAARGAVAAGHTAVKCAPFDGLWRANLDDPATRLGFLEGLDRIRAVREAVGADVSVLVDCHRRFTARSAKTLLDAVVEWDPYWIEDPVGDTQLDEWREIRESTDLRLAGGETLVELGQFHHFLEASRVDVVLPDIRYVGGIGGVRAVSVLAREFDVAVSPHNPAGPIATLATAHAISDRPNFLTLEYAYGECDWRSELVGGGEVIKAGHLHLTGASGLGFRLNDAVANAHRASDVVLGEEAADGN